MRIYWSIASFPELEHLDEQERRALLRHCHVRRITWKMISLSVLIGSICALSGSCNAPATPWRFIVAVPVLLASPLIACGVQIVHTRGQMRAYLERVAQHHKLGFCLYCGYNLKGLPLIQCPECGRNQPAPG